ncbi:PrsW family intramembrane metalloprotease [Streptomyces sp. NPDC006458]|uniref:PrsW family intramembrane metalloprotease n=1 Tax=Streptomyces sp. NPDC006458 TaxID=3154302 RepID=UPI0033BD3C51
MSHSPPPGTPRARIPGPQYPPDDMRVRRGLWRRCLWGGLALWALTATVTYATRSTAPLPTLILLGSFLVPVVFVLWAYEKHGRDLGVGTVLGCFLTGGALGVLGAWLMEYYLLRPSLRLFTGVGLIEEAAKLGALMFMLRGRPRIRGTRAGLVLGASVGLGFAAMEGAGYAFGAAVSTEGVGLRALLETEILRGLLAPFGHGLWTAIAGGVLLAHRRADGRFRLDAPVWGTWLGVSLLHAVWDCTHGIAVWLVARLTGIGVRPDLFSEGYLPRPTEAQQHMFAVFSIAGPAVVALAGLLWARSLTRRNPSLRNTP